MQKKLNKRTIVIVVCLLVIAVVCAVLLGERISSMQARKVQSEAKQLMEQGKKNTASAAKKPAVAMAEDLQMESETGEEEPEPATEPEVQSDFLPLMSENEHLVGWLTAGEYIDFPIVQYDNSYYLNHNFFGVSDSNGVPFLDENCDLFPRDAVLIIHGHNMKSGAIFGRLKRYLDFGYLSKNPVVSFRTIYDEGDVYYTPIAAFNISSYGKDDHYFDVKHVNFDSNEDFQSYLDEITERSAWEAKTDAVPGDRLLILVTCSSIYKNGRLLLVCRELREGESPESISHLYSIHE